VTYSPIIDRRWVDTDFACTDARGNAQFVLLSEFYKRTGCPVIVNTSFNVRGEPIVCTPEDAFRCFMGTGSKLWP
jgi:carbamoyltransferase